MIRFYCKYKLCLYNSPHLLYYFIILIMKRKYLEQQLEMIARGDHEKIMDYIAKYSLDTEAQIALINRGKHKEIMAYMARYFFELEAEEFLVHRGNVEEILFYLRKLKRS